ncbi:MerR family transcriptional regulator [Shewanella kaireitica]|uniref:MerR family transcriptional regulator n=1 Tax=Shewanella kaireitica TaxID=212021 RepID=UPI00200F5662|nr:MerR family transcriptional regulator [Shewanella kaireitica]MCL1092416.1 MerR family transcriptional regulator [Shewanella kaireitica]
MTQLKAETTAEDWFSIGEAAERTGVNPVTLRAWQRRFGIVIPKRTAKGHRLYSQAHIDQILEILEWLDKGVAISKVKPLLKGSMSAAKETSTGSDCLLGDEKLSFWQQNIGFLNQCCANLDACGLHRKLSELTAIYPFNVLKSCLFLPWLADFGKNSPSTSDVETVQKWLARELADAFSARRLALLEGNNPAMLLVSFGDVDEWQPILLSAELSANNVKHQQFSINKIAQLKQLISRANCYGVLLVVPPQFTQDDICEFQGLRQALQDKEQAVELQLWGIDAQSHNRSLGLANITHQRLSNNISLAGSRSKVTTKRVKNDS